jgi:hypothetical protein
MIQTLGRARERQLLQPKKWLRRISWRSVPECVSARSLADLSAQEAAVVVNPDFAATEQISNSRDCFVTAFGAGADCKNQITEGKLFRLAENLRMLFHLCSSDSRPGANVHCDLCPTQFYVGHYPSAKLLPAR